MFNNRFNNAVILFMAAGAVVMWYSCVRFSSPSRFAALGVTLAMISTTIGLVADERTKQSATKTGRPVIRAWTHNDVTVACAEEEFQRWQQQHERVVLVARAFAAWIDEPKELPVIPLMAFYTDDDDIRKRLGDYWTGSTRWFKDDMTKKCRVEWTEMFIPHDPSNSKAGKFYPIKTRALNLLVSGKAFFSR